MKVEVIMPQPGESIFEGTITKWLKKIGDSVERDEPLFVISTDKVDMDIPSPASGVLKEILFGEGETVEVKTVVAVIETEAEIRESVPQEAKAVPETDNTTLPSQALNMSGERKRKYTPLVRKIAREHHIELGQLPEGSGMGGRVTKQDILGIVAARKEEPVHEPAAIKVPEEPPASQAEASVVQKPEVKPLTQVADTGMTAGKIVPMTPMRKTIADRMVMSKQTSAHVTVVFEVDFSKVLELKNSMKHEYEDRYGIHLTFMPFVAQATIEALDKYPILNASVAEGNIVYHKDINLGIAVSVDEGLIVPVVQGANYKNITGLAKDMQDLAERARDGKLRLDDVQGGTFTITNNGRFGSLFGTPIILQPQVAIMGLGMVQKRVVVLNNGNLDTFGVRPMAYMPLTFDHRLIDGALADQFMSYIKERIENFTL